MGRLPLEDYRVLVEVYAEHIVASAEGVVELTEVGIAADVERSGVQALRLLQRDRMGNALIEVDPLLA